MKGLNTISKTTRLSNLLSFLVLDPVSIPKEWFHCLNPKLIGESWLRRILSRYFDLIWSYRAGLGVFAVAYACQIPSRGYFGGCLLNHTVLQYYFFECFIQY